MLMLSPIYSDADRNCAPRKSTFPLKRERPPVYSGNKCLCQGKSIPAGVRYREALVALEGSLGDDHPLVANALMDVVKADTKQLMSFPDGVSPNRHVCRCVVCVRCIIGIWWHDAVPRGRS